MLGIVGGERSIAGPYAILAGALQQPFSFPLAISPKRLRRRGRVIRDVAAVISINQGRRTKYK